ncbi:uncharacterized protein V1518DRAFT_411410 [Limtongia smithiae]|uniref:uncharacterized protein n=1 Tax=Limtongia smithiae TaxID=1125753 RepID=UPI0034CF5B83
MSILPIDKASVHRLTSGQVVIDLPTAVKELLENSLDANATSIEVRFKHYGTESIEVVDNGDGIDEENFAGIALKHHTSKIRQFSDLELVDTYGFRGEAISSLCAVSASLQITTCAKDSPMATKLEYNSNGIIQSKTRAAGKKGTTVTISKLFDGKLPVRRTELVKNCKREFAKCVTLLQAYGVIKTSVKIILSNVLSNNKKSILFSTNGNTSVERNIINVFGAKQFADILPFSFDLEVSPSRTYLKVKSDLEKPVVKVSGFISQPIPGRARNSSDRQFIYVNERPCNTPSVVRCFNECYRSFNVTQYPFFVANFEMPHGAVDVNVSPDKRTILMHNEESILEMLKDRLLKFLGENSQSATQRQATLSDSSYETRTSEPEISHHESQLSQTAFRGLRGLRGFNAATANSSDRLDSSEAESTMTTHTLPRKRQTEEDILFRSKRVKTTAATTKSNQPKSEISVPSGRRDILATRYQDSMQSEVTEPSENPLFEDIEPAPYDDGALQTVELDSDSSVRVVFDGLVRAETEEVLDDSKLEDTDLVEEEHEESSTKIPDEYTDEEVDFVVENEADEIGKARTKMESADDGRDESYIEGDEVESECIKQPANLDELPAGPDDSRDDVKEMTTQFPIHEAFSPNDATKFSTHSSSMQLHSNMDAIMQSRKWIIQQEAVTKVENRAVIQALTVEVDEGEEHLRSLNISKSDFAKMKIIGQFNLGFIIALRAGEKDDNEDLFIIDQHASDEKFNFERLDRTAIMSRQPLVIPKELPLTPLEELLVISNIELFTANGFSLNVDEHASPGKRCVLTAVPVFMSKALGLDDFMELLNVVNEAPGVFVRCSKIRQLLAMRACRSSVMIGTALHREKMRSIVDGLGTLDKPWNCPHGRPTMRHIADLGKWKSWDDDMRNKLVE